MWERLERSLSTRGINPQTYLQMQGKNREEMVTQLESDAEQALRREATLDAVADAEGIEVSDEEMLDALRSGEEGESPERVLERLRASGRDALLTEELRLRKAAELIAGAAVPIAQEKAAARERLWTPAKGEGAEKGEGEGKDGGLWTPGGDE
jgi:trigger factor